MVDADESSSQIDPADRQILKLLKSFYRLCIARPDKSIFITDPAFSVTLTTYVVDDRPQVMQLMTKILLSLTDSSNNCKLVAGLPDFESNIAKAIEKPFPPKIIHSLLVIQSRITALRVQKVAQATSTSHQSIFKSAGTKQLVYQLGDNDEEKQSTLQERSIPIKGVVSLCFTSVSGGGDHVMKSIYRVQEAFDPKILERCIFNCGYEKLHRVVRLDDGSNQTYEVFRDEVFLPTATEGDKAGLHAMPQYLDDNVMIFDPAQCVVPTDGANVQSSSWFSGVKAYLPFW